METEQFVTTGRRKNAIARVRMKAGSGTISVNGRTVEEYFRRASLKIIINQPMDLTEQAGQFDIAARVNGGGLTGQAGALQLGIARALVQSNEELRGTLRAHGLLTRDSRMVERKKYGQPGARKRYQFSKR